MSYSIYLRPPEEHCSTCGRRFEYVHGPNPTYNLTPIFDLALTGEELPNPLIGEAEVVLLGKQTDRPRGLRLLNGREAWATLGILYGALLRIGDPKLAEQFARLEPANGWGTKEAAVDVLQRLHSLAQENHHHTWEVC